MSELAKNCGTGAGGFQEGNSCGRGPGGGDSTSGNTPHEKLDQVKKLYLGMKRRYLAADEAKSLGERDRLWRAQVSHAKRVAAIIRETRGDIKATGSHGADDVEHLADSIESDIGKRGGEGEHVRVDRIRTTLSRLLDRTRSAHDSLREDVRQWWMKKDGDAEAAEKNCGTGAGGFQEGNSCGRGGGSGGNAGTKRDLESMRSWLAGNDPNGSYDDEEGMPPLTYNEAVKIIGRQVAGGKAPGETNDDVLNLNPGPRLSAGVRADVAEWVKAFETYGDMADEVSHWDGKAPLERGHVVRLEGDGPNDHAVVLESKDKQGDIPRVLVSHLGTGMAIAPTERVERKWIKPSRMGKARARKAAGRRYSGQFAPSYARVPTASFRLRAYGYDSLDRRRVSAKALGLDVVEPGDTAGLADGVIRDVDLGDISISKGMLVRGRLHAASEALKSGVRADVDAPITVVERADAPGKYVALKGSHRVAHLKLSERKGAIPVRVLRSAADVKKAMSGAAQADGGAWKPTRFVASARQHRLAGVLRARKAGDPVPLEKPGKVDEELWQKAKDAASKTYDEGDEAYWPVVVHIYEKMGGTFQSNAKKEAGDMGDAAIAAAVEEHFKKAKDDSARSEYVNPDGTFKNGFQGCMDFQMNVEGHPEENAKKICAFIGRRAGVIKSEEPEVFSSTPFLDSFVERVGEAGVSDLVAYFEKVAGGEQAGAVPVTIDAPVQKDFGPDDWSVSPQHELLGRQAYDFMVRTGDNSPWWATDKWLWKAAWNMTFNAHRTDIGQIGPDHFANVSALYEKLGGVVQGDPAERPGRPYSDAVDGTQEVKRVAGEAAGMGKADLGMSFNDIRDDIGEAVYRRWGRNAWVQDVYPETQVVIVRTANDALGPGPGGELYQVEYEIEDGQVTLGNAVGVRMTYEEDDDDLGKNCGTGAGGFQEGNSCGRGGGGEKKGPTGRTPSEERKYRESLDEISRGRYDSAVAGLGEEQDEEPDSDTREGTARDTLLGTDKIFDSMMQGGGGTKAERHKMTNASLLFHYRQLAPFAKQGTKEWDWLNSAAQHIQEHTLAKPGGKPAGFAALSAIAGLRNAAEAMGGKRPGARKSATVELVAKAVGGGLFEAEADSESAPALADALAGARGIADVGLVKDANGAVVAVAFRAVNAPDMPEAVIALALDKNCGTGSGGFQAGNSCGRGDGSAGGQEAAGGHQQGYWAHRFRAENASDAAADLSRSARTAGEHSRAAHAHGTAALWHAAAGKLGNKAYHARSERDHYKRSAEHRQQEAEARSKALGKGEEATDTLVLGKRDGMRYVAFDEEMSKATAEKGILYGVAYAPDDIDSQGEWASADDIEEAAHRFLTDHRAIKTQHADESESQVVESYIAPSDFMLGGRLVKRGTWVVAVKLSDADRQAYKEKRFGGFSIGGTKVVV